MSIFSYKNKTVEAPLSFESALSFVTGLSEEDWQKFTTVAHIRRYALQREAEELGVQLLPQSFIQKPNAPIWDLNDEDADIFEIASGPDFIEDLPPKVDPLSKQIDHPLPKSAKLKNFPGVPDGTEVNILSMDKAPLGPNPKNKQSKKARSKQ